MGRRLSGNGWVGSVRAAKRMQILERLRHAAATAQGNNPEDLPVIPAGDYRLPTITTAATATGTLTGIYTLASNPGVFRTSGGIPTARTDMAGIAAGMWCFPATKLGNGTTPAGNLNSFTADGEDNQLAWSVSFDTDADVVEFKLSRNGTAGRGYCFIVDGQYVSLAVTDFSALTGGVSYAKLTLPSRRMRTITVEGAATVQTGFASVAVGPTALVSYPRARMETTAIIAGDSFAEGVAPANLARPIGWAYRLQRRLGITRLYNLAIGATGYISDNGGARRKLVDQISDPVRGWGRAGVPWGDPDLVVFANLFNDRGGVATVPANRNNLKAQATAAWQAARGLYPDALIVVMGGFGGRSGPDADAISGDGALKEAFGAWADDFALFVPVNADAGTTGFVPYQTGTGYAGATTGVGNSDLTTGTDTIHPSDYGHDLIAQRAVADIVRRFGTMRVTRA